MKKITIALLFLFGVMTVGVAQTTTTTTPTTKVSKADKEALAAQKKADKEAKAAQKKADKAAKDAQKSTGLNKDGSVDKRLKANKQPKVQTPVAPTQTTAAPTTSTKTQAAPRATTTKTADPVSGTDSKGRTIYAGPRGGHYYIDKNGHKEYVKEAK